MGKMKKLRYALSMLINKYDGKHNGCPACKSEAYLSLSSAEFNKFPTSLRHCSGCKLLYRHPITLESESRKFYEEEYTESGLTTDLPTATELAPLLESNFYDSEKNLKEMQLLKRISTKLNRKLRILDYGANWGYNVYQLNQQDFIEFAAGYEYSKVRASYGVENLGVTYIDESQFSNDFDVVYSAHVIEHMYNPKLFETHVDKLINDDGYCIVRCPNGSMTGLLANPNIWKALWGEVHPNFISDEYLLNIFSDYEGAAFDAPNGLAKYDYLNHLDYPPVSLLPKTPFLLGVFRRLKKSSETLIE